MRNLCFVDASNCDDQLPGGAPDVSLCAAEPLIGAEDAGNVECLYDNINE